MHCSGPPTKGTIPLTGHLPSPALADPGTLAASTGISSSEPKDFIGESCSLQPDLYNLSSAKSPSSQRINQV